MTCKHVEAKWEDPEGAVTETTIWDSTATIISWKHHTYLYLHSSKSLSKVSLLNPPLFNKHLIFKDKEDPLNSLNEYMRMNVWLKKRKHNKIPLMLLISFINWVTLQVLFLLLVSMMMFPHASFLYSMFMNIYSSD